MAEDFVPAASLDSHTQPMDTKTPLMQGSLNSENTSNGRTLPSPTIEKLAGNREEAVVLYPPNEQRTSNASEKFFRISQIKTVSFYQALLSEFLGTMILTLICTSTGLPIGSTAIPALHGALVSGFIVATLIVGFGHASGAHINPAVTVSFLVVGEIDLLRALCYIGMQLLGAVSASALVRFLAPPSAHDNLGMTTITAGVSLLNAFIVEVIITFILCHTVHAICDKRRDDIGGSKALAVGLAVTVGCLFGGPYTGGSMNPARSFGPAAVMGSWENHWIYWIGPMTGSLIAAALYARILKQKTSAVVYREVPTNSHADWSSRSLNMHSRKHIIFLLFLVECIFPSINISNRWQTFHQLWSVLLFPDSWQKQRVEERFVCLFGEKEREREKHEERISKKRERTIRTHALTERYHTFLVRVKLFFIMDESTGRMCLCVCVCVGGRNNLDVWGGKTRFSLTMDVNARK